MRRIGAVLVLIGLFSVLAACGTAPTPTAPTGTTPVQQAATATPTPAPVSLKPLAVTPGVAVVGDTIKVTGEGLPAGKAVEFVWATWDGKYETKVDLGSIEFLKPAYSARRVTLGQATVGADGKVAADLKMPEDYGENHDIFAVVDGQEVAKGGVYLQRSVTVTPLEGPVGAPITVEVKGLGASAFQSTAGLRWDNAYVGFLSTTTTAGTARAVIRATGPVGQHVIDIGPASAAVPYLNPHQTPRKIKIPTFRFNFNVTRDAGAPAPSIEWPDKDRVAKNPTLPLSASREKLVTNVSASLAPATGPILSKPALKASGLTPNADVKLLWMTVTGSDVTGWVGSDRDMGAVKAGADGTLATTIEIPDELGGWHTLMLVQADKRVAEIPFFVERSLISAPKQVKAGQQFTVEIKGVGWTEMDNGVAVLYDNKYVGYACGFGSGGSVQVEFTALGGPGTHLIELYPMIYNRGFSQKHPWDYEVPQLTFAQDHPGLSLGYSLPVFRLAVEVVP